MLAQFNSIDHRAAIYARPRRCTLARSPIATRLFDVHLGFRRTSVVIDLTRKAARGDAHQLDSIDIAAILAHRRPRTRARWARSLCALLCASVIRALDEVKRHQKQNNRTEAESAV